MHSSSSEQLTHAAGSVPITTDHDWNSFARIIDVGGAYGSFLENLLAANKKPRGLLFDQAQVSVRGQLWPTTCGPESTVQTPHLQHLVRMSAALGRPVELNKRRHGTCTSGMWPACALPHADVTRGRPHACMRGQVIERARELWKTDERKRSLADRVELFGGDFFDAGKTSPRHIMPADHSCMHDTWMLCWSCWGTKHSCFPECKGKPCMACDTVLLTPAAAKIPAGKDGDAYVLRLIMHDWNNANCATILSNIRRAMGGARAKLIIAEVPRTLCPDAAVRCQNSYSC